jgi:HSP20 family protein
MSLVVSKRKNGRTLPSMVDDFFNSKSFFGPSLMDFDRDFFGQENFSLLPDANVIETDKEYQVELAVPGLERKDFKVEIKDDILSVSAEKETESKTERKNYRSKEFSYQSFYRSFTLPKNLIDEKIDAKYQNGVLTVTLPKKEVTVAKPTKQIKVG